MPDLAKLGIPKEVAAGLDTLRASLRTIAGERIQSLVLFGGAARGRYRPGISDVNLLIVLTEDTGALLRKVSPPIATARGAILLDPFILTAADFQSAVFVFPTKFLDIREHHLVIHGRDPFEGVDIPMEALRLRTEQEVRNLHIRFRRAVANAGDDALAQVAALKGFVVPLSLELASLLRLAGTPVEPDADLATIFRKGAELLGMDAGTLTTLSALREDRGAATDAAALCDHVLEALHQATRLASR